MTSELEGDFAMTNISISYQDVITSPWSNLQITWRWLCRWLVARREKLDQKLLADRLQELRQSEPHLYADLRLKAGDVPAPRSALPLIPHAVVAGYFVEEQH